MVAGTAQAAGRTRNPILRYVNGTPTSGPRQSKVYIPSEEDKAFLLEIAKRYEPTSRDHNHYQFHRQWWMSVAYYAGLQWVNWNEETSRVSEERVPRWKKLYVANKIYPFVKRVYSRLISEQLNYRVLPESPEPEDIKAAQLAEKILEHIKYVSEYDEAREEALLWSVVCGSGFTKLVWNPSKGPRVEVNEKEVVLGEFTAETVSPFQIRVPVLINSMKDLPWIIQITTRPMEYIWAHYPEKAPFVVPDTSGSRENFLEDRVNSLVGIRGLSSTLDTESHPNHVRLTEIWSLPCEGFPKGFRALEANGVILDSSDENPYVGMHVGLPFVKYDYSNIPGRFWGMGLVEQLILPQREYNVSRSQVIENQNLMSRPKWLVPKGAGLPKTAMTSRPGEIIEYNPALPKPEPVQISPLPNYVLDHQERLVREMMDIAAQQDVTQGKAPASMRSGVAVNLLQQADMAVLGMPRTNMFRADKAASSFMLKMAMDRYKERRVLAILGRENAFDVRHFTGADLRGHTSVRVYAEGGLLDSAAARQQNVMDYVQLGILDPSNPQEKAEILKMLRMGDVESYVHERTLDQRNADQENEIFTRADEEGGIVMWPAERWEDHGVHIERHNLYRKTVKFRMLPEDVKSAFDAHVMQHEAMLQQQMMAQQEAVMATRGAPGETGKPSAPKGGAPSQGGGGSGEKKQASGGGDSGGSGSGGGGGE